MKASIFIAKDKLINDYKTKVTALGCELDCVYEDIEPAIELARKSGSFIICYDKPVKEIYRMYAEARHLKYIQEKLKEKGYVWTDEEIQKALDNPNFKDIIDKDVWQVVQTYKAVRINDPRKAEFSDRAFTGILFCFLTLTGSLPSANRILYSCDFSLAIAKVRLGYKPK